MRYIIGIDLGTTNSVLAFVDTEQPSLPIQLLAIPQLTAAGKVDALLTLPSFCYLSSPNEWTKGALKLPWKEESTSFVGQFAKLQGARVPTRLVQSAKSWLCNVAANRRDKLLPVDAADLSQRLSPIEASAKYLIHLRDAWNATMSKGNPDLELEEQEIILTVPASFDEVARTLTVEAAREAGFLHVTLVEEPQAAFYSWISLHEKEWQSQFHAGNSILVCDVGGGTTDFSLIEIQEQEGRLSFQRMAVGDHLLLGGDNIDATLAHFLEQKFLHEGRPPLESAQWLMLQAEARNAKEALLHPEAQQNQFYSVVLHGLGSAVVKGSVSITVNRAEVEELLLKGFFGLYPLNEALQLKASRGIRSMGLPYEDEPSITKHLAHFLQQAHYFDHGKKIDFILFNGGTFKPEIFQQAIEEALNSWYPQRTLQRLSTASLDLAIARGAAYYGKARRGLGVVIGGGLPRTYYLKIDVKDLSGQMKSKALTLLPRGSKEGRTFHPEQIFALRPNTPVVFHLMTSHVRLHDKEGDLIDIDPAEMQFLPLIQTLMRFGRKLSTDDEKTIPVKIGIQLTPIGTVELWLESQKSDHKWSLEFQIRSAEGQDLNVQKINQKEIQSETFEKGHLNEAKAIIEHLFQVESKIKPNQIMDRLEKELRSLRKEWGPSFLRELWTSVIKMAPQRKSSLEYEARWWNLAGFFLRPGYGYPLDDFRIKELWKIILADLKTSKSMDVLIQMWICFRRVAGGLNKGQQMQIASELVPSILNKKVGKIDIRKGETYLYSEKIRVLGALERLDLSLKIRLGEALVDRILYQEAENSDYWSLGRIGARHLIYGSAGQVVPKDVCAQWIEQLLTHKRISENEEAMIFLLSQLGRKTDHRELNISDSLVQKILSTYPQNELKEWLLKEHQLTLYEQEKIFGDQLPAGLILEENS